jgi:photosystem II stability/assembly factor-like uncharacterized protein
VLGLQQEGTGRSVYPRRKQVKSVTWEGRTFFSEEKNQTTFAPAPASRLRPWPIGWELRQKTKVFWFFSSEKNVLPYAFAKGLGFLLAFSLLTTTALAAAPPAATPLNSTDTDQPIWRAMHGLLLGVARAGGRVVAVGNAGAVLLSDDGGTTWRAAQAPTAELLTGVLFTTPTEGWIVGQDELVLHTKDAGETWTQQHFAKDADQTLFSITAFTPPHLVTTGAYDLILETQDGSTWQESKIPNLDEDYHLNCATARGEDLLVTGEAGQAFIRHAGNWAPVKLPYDGSQFACVLGKRNNFYSFGLRGSAFRLEPSETTWSKIDLGGGQSTFGAAVLADGRIAIVGSSGMARLIDQDTGKVTNLVSGTEAALSGVVEVKLGRLVAVGEDGVHVIEADPDAAEAAP